MSRPAVDPPEWLRTLPVAPEYRPTVAEFADPIAYIFKIETEASRYGICKIVPPLPAPPFEATLERLKASFAANAAAAGDAALGPTFPTRLQQVGLSTKNRRAANRRVWESGERYTLEAFRVKARDFELPRHAAPPKNATPLQLEALFWGACAARPFNVEYGNDMPGSGFAAPEELELGPGAGGNAAATPRDVGETEWNMRLAPRAPGSLLRAMGRDVAGVTTPMLYVAMLYSWFAWHVEDHELHSLNYLHFGKPKTWYGVPRDAMLAFEDAVRVHGYADDLNAIMAFQTLNEKTTVLSPEVLLSSGVPCCRLVQNPGEFVITFPGAYHSGFSHGFNCGEATNIATPRWLQVAKEAAIRRASTNCGPMVSHYQLLYELALSLRPREPKKFHDVPRSSRLRDKKKNEGEIMVKETFVESVIENNNFLSILLGNSSCIVIPEIAFPLPSLPTMMGPELTVKQGLIAGSFSSNQQKDEGTPMPIDGDATNGTKGIESISASQSANCATSSSTYTKRKLYETKYGTVDSTAFCLSTSGIQSGVIRKDRSHQGSGLLDQGRLPCVQCGILSFACVAIIQPKEAAVQFVISRECISSSANHGEIMKSDDIPNWIAENRETVLQQGHASGTDDNTKHSSSSAQVSDRCRQLYNSSTPERASALGLLASAYDSSDSDEEAPDNISANSDKNDAANIGTNIQFSGTLIQHQETNVHIYEEECDARITASLVKPIENESMPITQAIRGTDISHSIGLGKSLTSYEEWSAYLDLDDGHATSGVKAPSDITACTTKGSMKPNVLTLLKYNKDSCRMHVFCLEHALETWTQLQQIGGADIMLLCHPEYPRAESAAKVIAEELGMKNDWKDITFKEATEEDIGRIQMALLDEDAEPTSSDWAVKLGINIYYSAKQSKSPLYSKQVPYNSIIYKAFGQENPDSLTDDEGQRSGMTKKKVAGWWCGKVWMSNQVHPFLAREHEEQNHDMVYRKAKFSANVSDRIQDEPSTRCTNLINRSTSTRISGRKERDTVEKSRAKKKIHAASSEDYLHCSDRVMKSEATHDHKQPRHFHDSDKHESGDESGEALNTQQYQHRELQNINKRSNPKKRKDGKRNSSFHELHDEHGDVDYKLEIGSRDNTTVDNSGNSSGQGFDAGKVKSGVKLQGSKRKPSKCKANGDLSNRDNKFVTKKQKKNKANREFHENHNEDNNVDLLHLNTGDEATLDSWDELLKEKTGDVKVKSRGKVQSGKRKPSKCQTTEEKLSSDIETHDRGDEAAIDNWDEIPEGKTHDVKVKSRGKVQTGKRKPSKCQITEAKLSCDIETCDRGDGVAIENWDEIPETKTYDVKVKSRGKMQSGKRKGSKPLASEAKCHSDIEACDGGNETTTDKWDAVPKEKTDDVKVKSKGKIQSGKSKASKCQARDGSRNGDNKEAKFPCDIEGCDMSFSTQQDLSLHKRDICPVKGCKKKFFCHKYLLQHRKVHIDDRPLKCAWKGCKKTFKWPWARTEHMRVHTGVRPYKCTEPGCTQTFRFVSDFSRHKRKTGHCSDKKKKSNST